tara:strand:- start:1512 stop:2363 length:852 start_codon:yes stop_codon:yes gene_type:complete
MGKQWIKDKCSANTSEFGFTCYSKESLEKLKIVWNKRHPENKIDSNNSKDIWQALRDKLKLSCNREKCWLRTQFMKNDLERTLLEDTFAPDTPDSWESNPTEWLDSDNITAVMKQYEKLYPIFEFIGPTPIDYDTILEQNECVWNDMCKFNLNQCIDRGIKKIGIVFNLDKHDKGGSHWVCLFIDISKEEIYFFDSYGFRIHPGVNKFAKMVIKQSINSPYTNKFVRYSNDIEHQLVTDSECGTYCLYIIIELLKGADFKKLVSKRIPDRKMLQLRKTYFNEQ